MRESAKLPYLATLRDILVNHKKDKNPLRDIILTRRLGMIRRCECKSNPSYKEYGARGISVCDLWRETKTGPHEWLKWYCKQLSYFAGDFDSVAEALSALSIDRKLNYKGYSPKNCNLIKIIHNNYTTSEPARCIFYNGDFMPIWWIEARLLGRNNEDGKGISDLIRKTIANAKKGAGIQRTPHAFICGHLKYTTKGYIWDLREFLQSTNYYVFYDFYKNPLIFDKTTLKAQCLHCNGAISISYERKSYIRTQKGIRLNHTTISAKCDKCDFNEILVQSGFKNAVSLEYLQNLPKKLLNKNIKARAFYADSRDRIQTHNRRNYYYRAFCGLLNADVRAKELAKVKARSDKHYAKMQIAQGVDLDKIRKKVFANIAKVPILALKTRKAIRERLKKENHSPIIIKKARERMRELQRIEKQNAKDRNPALYWARVKRENDKKTLKKRGADYVIKPRKNNAEKFKDVVPKPKAQKEIIKEYYTRAELESMGLISSPKPAQSDSANDKMISEFLKSRQSQKIAINYNGRVFVWDNPHDRIFCNCKHGLIGLDMQNQRTDICAECGFQMDFKGKRLDIPLKM